MKFVFVTIFVICSFIASITIGLFEIPDAYFYYVLGKFLLTGELLPVAPLNAQIPQTLFAPVYAIISYIFVQMSPGPIVLLPFVQLLMVGISAGCLYLSIKKLFHRKQRIAAVLLFLFLPFNLLYAFMYMSEVTTMLFVSLCLLAYTRITPRILRYSIIVAISSFLSLTRFAFIPWVAVSIIGLTSACVWYYKQKRAFSLQQYLSLFPAVVGVCCILLWIVFNFHWYQKPMLSSFTGRHIYNNVITAGKFIPQRSTDPDVQKFLSYIPPGSNLARPWWDIQPYFAGAFYEQQLTEIEIDQLFLRVSLAGIQENLLAYIVHVFRMAIVTPNTPPYVDNVVTQLGIPEPGCPICRVKSCRFEWITEYCRPVIHQPIALDLFARLVLLSKSLYPVVSGILLITAVIGTLAIFYKRQQTLMVITVMLYIQHFFQSASEWVEGRFLLPLYPLYTIIIVYGLITITRTVKHCIRILAKQTQ